MQSVFDLKWNSDYEPDLEQNQSYWCMCASQGIKHWHTQRKVLQLWLLGHFMTFFNLSGLCVCL